MAKQRVMEIFQNKTYRLLRLRQSRKDKTWHLPKKVQETDVAFTPGDIIEEQKPIWKFWRNPRRMLIHFQGNKRCVGFGDWGKGKDGLEIDKGFLTLDDILKSVKTTIAKTLQEIKPINQSQFLILCLMCLVNTVMILWIGNRLGAFQ